MKPVITGFIDMQDISWHNANPGEPTFTLDNVNMFPGLFGGVVYNATWREMQRLPGGALDTTRLDRALHQVQRYNLVHPAAPLGVKLRIFAGNKAPDWAKRIGGPIRIQRNLAGCHTPDRRCPITIGRVWGHAYIVAWREFLRKVAERYDSHPLIRSVAVTSCTMQTDEPFVMPTRKPLPTGYTDKAGKACLMGAVNDYKAWRQTAIDYTLNPFMNIQTKAPPDVNFTISVMNACRAELGTRCELGNHAFESGISPTSPLGLVITAISEAGPPIHYQTVGPNTPGFNWAETMRAARQYNATAIELWPGFNGFTTLSPETMRRLRILFGKPALPTDAAP